MQRVFRRLFVAAVAATSSCRAQAPTKLSVEVEPLDGIPAASCARYAALRAEGNDRAGFGGIKGQVATGPIVSERGGRCAEPPDATCPEEIVKLLESSTGRVAICLPTSGAVEAVAADKIVARFGAIDSPAKAALQAWLRGGDLVRGPKGAFANAAEGGGFEVIVERRITYCGDHGDPGKVFIGHRTFRVLVHVAADGKVTDRVITQTEELANHDACRPMGRRPEGYEPVAIDDTPGAYFARAAHLEAASVFAFERLAHELEAFAAPARLVRRARRAARDEIRHAAMMTSLARRHGHEPIAPTHRVLEARTLDAVARENASEGCVFETFAALLATFQAEHAGDAETARTMNAIARDETRHAALAWEIDRWARSALPGLAPQLDDEWRVAMKRLRASLGASSEVARQLGGEPTAAQAVRLFERLASAEFAPPQTVEG